MAQRPIEGEGDILALAFSGGGARASAFSLGALQGLREMRGPDGTSLLDRVRLVTAVSGGSVTAAYFGQHGTAGLDTFRTAFLDKTWRINTNAVSAPAWLRAMDGGMNDRRQVANWLDREVYGGRTMDQLWQGGGPQIWLNATDLYNGTPFAFAPLYFDALCADLGSVRVADAVAASMAFPLVFQPVVVAPHVDSCTPAPAWVAAAPGDPTATALVRRTAQAFAAYRDPNRQPFIHLVDGGVLDNLGLSSISLLRATGGTPYGPLSARAAVNVRRMTFLVINAEQTRNSTWQHRARGPNRPQVVAALLSIAIEAPNRSAYDAFRLVAERWERDVRAWRCALPASEVMALRGRLEGWDCNDVHFTVAMIGFADLDAETRRRLGRMPTNVSLPRPAIDALVEAGRRGVRENPAARALPQ